MNFDHIALTSNNINKTIEWYKDNFTNMEILYQDDTWAMCKIDNLKLSFVSKTQHPPHIAFSISNDEKLILENSKKKFKVHRDGTQYCYIKDIDGNILEYIVR